MTHLVGAAALVRRLVAVHTLPRRSAVDGWRWQWGTGLILRGIRRNHALQHRVGQRVLGQRLVRGAGLEEGRADVANKVWRDAALAVDGACSTGAAAHKLEPVDRVVLAALLAETRRRLARVVGRVQLVVGVLLQLPGGVAVRHVDALLPHAAPELLRVVAERTLEEVAGGERE